jgi:hypothetical protein
MAQPARGKRTLAPAPRITHRKLGFTVGMMDKIKTHQARNDGKSWPDAVRDIFNAGCRALALDQGGVAGTIGVSSAASLASARVA